MPVNHPLIPGYSVLLQTDSNGVDYFTDVQEEQVQPLIEIPEILSFSSTVSFTRSERNSSMIYEYTANPIKVLGKSNSYFIGPKFNRSKNAGEFIDKHLYLGIELEVEAKRGKYEQAVEFAQEKLQKFAILKSDGSLGEGGFEICSVPATLDFHLGVWDNFLEGASAYLNSWHSGRCGLHVHMSASAITPLTLAKMLVFINSDENRTFLTVLAGRQVSVDSAWCKTEKYLSEKFTNVVNGHNNRYMALNLATRKPTVEVRIFRGNLRKLSFYKGLEFCVALRDFCLEIDLNNINKKTFETWLIDNRSKYRHLINWMHEKEMLPIKISNRSTLIGLRTTNVPDVDGGKN